jgi:predicted nucleic acid-binding protein
MGVIEVISGRRLFVDTAPFIYLIEKSPDYLHVVEPIFRAADAGDVRLFSSSLTLLEVLVKPLRLKRHDIVVQYEHILTSSSSIRMQSLDVSIARRSAEIRAKYNFKTPDSIQLATALSLSADLFITNDKQLKIDEITTVTLDELAVM